MDDDTLAKLVPLLAKAPTNANMAVFEYLAPTDLTDVEARHVDLLAAIALPNKTKQDKGARSAAVGAAFEALVRSLLKGSLALTFERNVRTTIAEIDFLLKIEPLGGAVAMLREARTHILGEAKIYTQGIKTQWVTELMGLMDSHSANVSFLFLGCAEQKVQRQFRIALALAAAKGKFVVPFGQKQIAAVRAGQNFLWLVSDQYVSAAVHTVDLYI